jgi:hypothetical protein
MDYGVGLFEQARGRRSGHRIPRLESICLQIVNLPVGTRQRDDQVAIGAEQPAKRAPDEPGSASNQDVHPVTSCLNSLGNTNLNRGVDHAASGNAGNAGRPL